MSGCGSDSFNQDVLESVTETGRIGLLSDCVALTPQIVIYFLAFSSLSSQLLVSASITTRIGQH